MQQAGKMLEALEVRRKRRAGLETHRAAANDRLLEHFHLGCEKLEDSFSDEKIDIPQFFD